MLLGSFPLTALTHLICADRQARREAGDELGASLLLARAVWHSGSPNAVTGTRRRQRQASCTTVAA